MKDLSDFWTLPASEQNQIREANPGYADTEEDHQTFLNALFPVATAEEYDLSDKEAEGQAK